MQAMAHISYYPMPAMECSPAMLGTLAPFYSAPDDPHSTIINGVQLPERVIQELRRLGMALSWLTPGELEDAVIACNYDGVLIDDPDGDNFRDKLTLTHAEKIKKRKIAETNNDDCGIYEFA